MPSPLTSESPSHSSPGHSQSSSHVSSHKSKHTAYVGGGGGLGGGRGGGSGAGGGAGPCGQRPSQSGKSVPGSQMLETEPSPPSSQSPLLTLYTSR